MTYQSPMKRPRSTSAARASGASGRWPALAHAPSATPATPAATAIATVLLCMAMSSSANSEPRARPAGEKRRRALHVVAIGGPPLADVLLEQADARHLEQQEGHQQRRDQAPGAGRAGRRQRHQREA